MRYQKITRLTQEASEIHDSKANLSNLNLATKKLNVPPEVAPAVRSRKPNFSEN